MIARIHGIVVEKNLMTVIVDVGGVGYEIQTTLRDNEQAILEKSVTFYTYHHIREQSQELFGFRDATMKELFIKLLSVKNVGPKVALAVLDIGPVQLVKEAIAGGDVKVLQSAKGIGKRAAEQIIVELRDKVGAIVTSDAEQIVSRGGINHNDEALQALMALGYSDVDAQKALNDIDKNLRTEERVKKALKNGN
jgi:Holliday junction DNA helicase RuvA